MFDKSAVSSTTADEGARNGIAVPLRQGGRPARRALAGGLTVELPNGRQIRFGDARREQRPVLRLNRYRALGKLVRRGTIGFAEAYMDGDLDCDDLTGLFRFFVANRDRFRLPGRYLFKVAKGDRAAHRARRNSRRGSQRNISEHYDLGNDFFQLWLDPDMVYSSGLYAGDSGSLEAAQSAKFQRIVDLLDLSGGEDILEIGCGWGGFARFAARAHGASVTGLTLSHEQLAHARQVAEEEQLAADCAFRLQDYRDADGRYDRIVSIEMIEAVGEEYWPEYFQVLGKRLKPGGSAVLQAITIDEHAFDEYRSSADFIQRFIFPGGMLPTRTIIRQQAEAAGLTLDHGERFGQSYARTLREWRRRFDAAWPQIARLGYDEHFRRRWRYYLAYCEAGFMEGRIDVGIYRLRKRL